MVGRAFGLGIRTSLAVDRDALKQAFHTQPLCAWCDESDLTRVSPPEKPEEPETTEQTLNRIFEDPVRLLFVRTEDGQVLAATRESREVLGPAEGVASTQIVGALAAVLSDGRQNYEQAARDAYRLVVDRPVPSQETVSG